jgi:hypothetical protein
MTDETGKRITIKLLIVEDDDSELQTYHECCDDFIKGKKVHIDSVECKSVADALNKLDKTFDGAIIDLKLGPEGGEGNQVIKNINDAGLRIPIIILTGTPGDVDPQFKYVSVLKRGEKGAGYADILEHFLKIYNTGLTRIMGGRGTMESILGDVFSKSLVPHMSMWEKYGEKDSGRTEKALLRYALNHILQFLDDDQEKCFPEEMFLLPPLRNQLCPGSIVEKKGNDKTGPFYIIMNPPCDLVSRDGGNYKTERILLAEIKPYSEIQKLILRKCSDEKDRKEKLTKALNNEYALFYHWLPKIDKIFEGGFINFRRLTAVKPSEFNRDFKRNSVQISPSFMKNILSRFSSYYGRQGQPDLDNDAFINAELKPAM